MLVRPLVEGSTRELRTLVGSQGLRQWPEPCDRIHPALDLLQEPDDLLVRSRAEGEAVRQSLAITRGNLSKAVDLLGVTRTTLYDLLEKLGIDAASQDSAGASHPTDATGD